MVAGDGAFFSTVDARAAGGAVLAIAVALKL